MDTRGIGYAFTRGKKTPAIENGRGGIWLDLTEEQLLHAPQKREGELPRETSPSLSDFLKIWSGFQITT